MRLRIIATLILAMLMTACAGRLASNPSLYSVRNQKVTAGSLTTTLVLVTPSAPPKKPVLVMFASGDGGLTGVSKAVLQHLADQGHYVAAFSSREILRPVKRTGGTTRSAALAAITSLIAQSKRELGLADDTPLIVTGMSRGANFVIASAGAPTLQPHIIGAVAVALTRETDYLDIPDGTSVPAGVHFDDQRRVLTYPAIARLGSIPLAIIQSTNDSYVPSAESRQLLGPDTPTRRLYEVPSRNHGFDGGRETLMRDLDDAMKWIVGLTG